MFCSNLKSFSDNFYFSILQKIYCYKSIVILLSEFQVMGTESEYVRDLTKDSVSEYNRSFLTPFFIFGYFVLFYLIFVLF